MPEREEEEAGGMEIRAIIEPELAEKVRYLKKVLGYRRTSELIRYLIVEKYERLISARERERR